MSEKSLLPCPFCKTELEIIGKGHYFAHKTNNGCILQHLCFEIDDEEAVKAWNTRKPVEDVLERLEELRKLNYEAWETTEWVPDKTAYINMANSYAKAIEIIKEGLME